MNDLKFWIFIFVMILFVTYFIIFVLKDSKHKAYNVGTILFLALIFNFLIYIPSRLADNHGWGIFLALLPAAIVTSHAIFIGLFRQKEVKADSTIPSATRQGHLLGAMQLIDSDRDRYFSAASLGIRYGLPALLLVGVGIIGYPFLYYGTLESVLKGMQCVDPVKICALVVAARLGNAGSYVYVLTYLGERNFRHDVTSGGAMWCVATLILGPILAVMVALTWSGGNPTGFTSYALYFSAGLAPRQVAFWLMEAVRRLQQSSEALLETPRVLPLTKIRGITKNIESRLQEEGIEDVFTLAMANPLWLLRNTPFSKRQIVDWIDEALLIKVVPDKWETLEKMGVTGVIDLAFLQDQKKSFPNLFEEISNDSKISIVELEALSQRLYLDKQVQVIWALYQIDRESVADFEINDINIT